MDELDVFMVVAVKRSRGQENAVGNVEVQAWENYVGLIVIYPAMIILCIKVRHCLFLCIRISLLSIHSHVTHKRTS